MVRTLLTSCLYTVVFLLPFSVNAEVPLVPTKALEARYQNQAP